MLIRSQNKKYLVSTNNISFYVMDSEVICFGISGIEDSDYIILGHYETESKAMKVLDMIQEAYMNFEASKITSTGLATATCTGSCDTPESVAHGIKVLKGYVEAIRESVVFQMPADSEVKA